MTGLLSWLSDVAPWVWTASALTGFLISSRAWLLARAYARTRRVPGALTPYIQRQASMRMARLLIFTIVGAASIATYFRYPYLRQHPPALPWLLQVSSLFTLLALLAAPITDGVMGYWTLRFLLDDPLPRKK